MANNPKKRIYIWRISRLKATPAAVIGLIEAPDAETAIKEAIVKFEINDSEQQKRLVAHRRYRALGPPHV